MSMNGVENVSSENKKNGLQWIIWWDKSKWQNCAHKLTKTTDFIWNEKRM